MAILMAIYYAFDSNPTFSGMKPFQSFNGVLEYTGMAVFSMSCAGVVIPIENNMHSPRQFNIALFIGKYLSWNIYYGILNGDGQGI